MVRYLCARWNQDSPVIRHGPFWLVDVVRTDVPATGGTLLIYEYCNEAADVDELLAVAAWLNETNVRTKYVT